jgi:hypothetical protein
LSLVSVCAQLIHMNKSTDKLSHSEAGQLGYLKTKQLHEARYIEIREKYIKDPKKCKLCCSPLPYEIRWNKFCSHSCAAKNNNKGVNRYKKIKKQNTCKNCGVYVKKVFCSQACQMTLKWLKQKEKIETTGVFDSVRAQNYTKKYLIEVNGYACMICKAIEWQGQPIPLVLDHVDGDSTNNKVDNIRLVCANCDMQLPTYKNKNKGKGRASRMERYRLKKTY